MENDKEIDVEWKNKNEIKEENKVVKNKKKQTLSRKEGGNIGEK